MDPLIEIVTRHIFRASTDGVDIKNVVDAIVVDYMRLLYTQGVHIPQTVQILFVADLKEEIQDMIMKKTQSSVGSADMAIASEKSMTAQALRKIS